MDYMIKYIKLICILVIMMMIFPMHVFAKGVNISIKDIEVLGTSEYAEELTPATFNGLNLKLNLKFKLKDDYITYLLKVQNSDNEDYILKPSQDDYLVYGLENDVLKANTTSEVQLTVKYNTIPTNEQFNKSIHQLVNMNITDKDGNFIKIENPKTGQLYYLIILGLLMISLIIILSFFKNRKKKLLLLIVLLPLSVLASQFVSINIDSTYELKDMSGLGYKGEKLELDEFFQNMKTEMENKCRNNNIDEVDDIHLVFDADSNYSADVILSFQNDDFFHTTVSFEMDTDSEESDSKVVVGDCTYDPEFPFHNFSYDGVSLTSREQFDTFAVDSCISLRNALESVDAECVKQYIDFEGEDY